MLPKDVSCCRIVPATPQNRLGQFIQSHAVLLLTGVLLLVLSLHFVNPVKPDCSVVSPNLLKSLTGQAGIKQQAEIKQEAERKQQLQAEASKALKEGRFLTTAFKSRLVSFKGHDLLITVPANDEFVGNEILSSGRPYQTELLGPLMDMITLGSTVVDVGGNLGSFTAFFAAATGLQGRVYSFEPQNKMFQLICTNAVNNGLTNVHPQNAALSFTADRIHMSGTVPDGSASGSNIREAEKAGQRINYGGMMLGKGGEEVQSRTLDSYNLTGVSLIKIDAQGAEPLVIYGGRETIQKNLPVVVYEKVAGFGLTPDMIDSMHIPQEVQAFGMAAYLDGLGYQQMAPQPSGMDIVWLPPTHPLLKTGRRLLM